jgi:hypothetical protein
VQSQRVSERKDDRRLKEGEESEPPSRKAEGELVEQTGERLELGEVRLSESLCDTIVV